MRKIKEVLRLRLELGIGAVGDRSGLLDQPEHRS